MPEQFVQRLAVVSAVLNLKTKTQQAQALGIGRTTLYNYELDPAMIPDQVVQRLEELERQINESAEHNVPNNLLMMCRNGALTGSRKIPVIGMAHAGAAASYEEIPPGWQDWVDSDCRDDKAFGVRLEGNSMADCYQPDDILILSPSNEIYNGCLAVIKMKSDGYLFRQVEKRSDHLKLIPLNPNWRPEEMSLSEVEWAFPLYGMYRQVWKG